MDGFSEVGSSDVKSKFRARHVSGYIYGGSSYAIVALSVWTPSVGVGPNEAVAPEPVSGCLPSWGEVIHAPPIHESEVS